MATTFLRSAVIAPLALPLSASMVFAALAYAWAGIPPHEFIPAYLGECATALSVIGPALWTASFSVACLGGAARFGLLFLRRQGHLECGVVARLSRTTSIWVRSERAAEGSLDRGPVGCASDDPPRTVFRRDDRRPGRPDSSVGISRVLRFTSVVAQQQGPRPQRFAGRIEESGYTVPRCKSRRRRCR